MRRKKSSLVILKIGQVHKARKHVNLDWGHNYHAKFERSLPKRPPKKMPELRTVLLGPINSGKAAIMSFEYIAVTQSAMYFIFL